MERYEVLAVRVIEATAYVYYKKENGQMDWKITGIDRVNITESNTNKIVMEKKSNLNLINMLSESSVKEVKITEDKLIFT